MHKERQRRLSAHAAERLSEAGADMAEYMVPEAVFTAFASAAVEVGQRHLGPRRTAEWLRALANDLETGDG